MSDLLKAANAVCEHLGIDPEDEADGLVDVLREALAPLVRAGEAMEAMETFKCECVSALTNRNGPTGRWVAYAKSDEEPTEWFADPASAILAAARAEKGE